jgi:hypothetical protein
MQRNALNHLAHRSLVNATILALGMYGGSLVRAEPGAANVCPTPGVSTVNLSPNPSFEVIGGLGATTSFPATTQAAAANWTIHSKNPRAPVQTRVVTTDASGPVGLRMIEISGGLDEQGIVQSIAGAANQRRMVSAWVKVMRGRVALSANSAPTGPSAWSSKIGEWEQLRICPDGTVPSNFISIYNQAPTGGLFYIERVEVRAMP